MATGQIKDPYTNFNFLVEIDGITRAAFQSCSGFDSTIDVIEHREGGDNITTRKLPGMNKYSNIQLKWGMTDGDRQLYDWHLKAVKGDIDRKNGSIVLLNRKGEEVARWNFIRAWPIKYDAPDLDAEKADVAIAMLELAHEGLEMVYPETGGTMFQTDFTFTLPCGYLDEQGTLHREGTMRRATAADEILPLKDPRVVKNQGYLVVILLSRVVTQLGSVPQINPKIIESLFATDLAFLQNLYNKINQLDESESAVLCPNCQHEFHPEENGAGGSLATPLSGSTGR